MATNTDLQHRLRGWWETVGAARPGGGKWDPEIRAINDMMDALDGVPDWALEIRDAMPRYGFEMCSHRWVEGLGDVLRMLSLEAPFPSEAGHCGDVPPGARMGAKARALSVQWWIHGLPAENALDRRIADELGERSPEELEAAACFVELARTDAGEIRTASGFWRKRGDRNEILHVIFEGEGLDGLLENRCGFKFLGRLDAYIRIIGGDMSSAEERHGVCVDQIRFAPRDDRPRFETTRGYAWGLAAYLSGHDEEWLREHKPDCARAAIYALRSVSKPGPATPLRRWLAASFLKAISLWCARLAQLVEPNAPPEMRDLPGVLSLVA